MTYSSIIGIDPGVNIGMAEKFKGKISDAKTIRIWELWDELEEMGRHGNCLIVVEDARQRKWYGSDAHLKREGAGWIKILCGQIEAFLIEKEIPHKMIHPIKGGTKLTAAMVAKLTGWREPTNEHTRDAIMIAWMN